MKKKRAKFIAGLLCCALAATSPLQSIANTDIAKTENGFDYANYSASNLSGYSVVKADASAVQGGTLTIPDSVDGTNVVHLDERFMSGSGATKVVFGENISALNWDAFFEAKNLEEIETSSRRFVVSDGDPALYSAAHNVMVDYPSAASTGSDYKVNDSTVVIYSMDNANFGKLDLGKADTLARHVLAGTTVDELVLADNAQTSLDGKSASQSRQQNLELPGLHAGRFSLTQATENSYLQTDGQSLYTNSGTLIKLASGVESGVDWGKYSQIDTEAFDTMAQYWSLSESIPTNLKKNKVFHFYNQDNGVFIVNDQVAFCYNSSKHIPDNVTDSKDFNAVIDGDHYDQVKAVMFVGVPYNGTGLFEKVFGVSYEQAVKDVQMSGTGDAALNAVSSMVWKIVDGKPSDVIQGIGGTSYFTQEKVDEYTRALEAAAENAEDYTFSPTFQIDGGTLIFREQDDGKYLSDPFTVAATNGKGVVDENYKIQLTMSGSGFSIQGKDEMTFDTGEEIRIVSETQPQGQPLSFAYEKGILTYYTPGNTADEQFLLVSGTQSESTTIMYSFEIKPQKEDLTISKRAVSSSDELPGAALKLTKQNGDLVDQWTSEETPHTLPMPEDGTYVLTEVTAPQGYEVAEEITFKIQDGQVVDGPIIMYDKPTPPPTQPDKLTISKRVVGGSDELPGALLKLAKEDGTQVEQWTSGNEPHVIDMPEDGTYTLTEITAPDGYDVAETITFTIQDGKVAGGAVIMYDKPSQPKELTISKRAVGGSDELPGATLKLTKQNGDLVEQWTSGNTPHTLTMPEDGTYVLTEITAPQGYEVAESITFMIKDGAVEGGMVIMYDKPEDKATPSEPDKPTEHSFEISKRDATTSEELPGAKLQIKDADGNVVEEWTSSDTPHKVTDLKDGTYTLTEVTAPNGFQVAETITFTVKDGTVDGGKVVMYDKPYPSKPNGSGGGSVSYTPTPGGDSSHGPGVTPTPTPQPVPQPAPQPQPQQSDGLPKTQDQPSSVLFFWASAITLAGVLGDKKYRKVKETVD